MTTVDFITELFCQVDNRIGHLPKHSQANLDPSEVVTLALLYALTGKCQHGPAASAPGDCYEIVDAGLRLQLCSRVCRANWSSWRSGRCGGQEGSAA
jgi:hypothetical protein